MSNDLIEKLRAENAKLREALRPFAEFVGPRTISSFPPHMPITNGSQMARKQLTIGDCDFARTVYRMSVS